MSPWLLLAIQLCCGVALGLTGVTLLSLLSLQRRAPAAPPRWPALVLLRPCAGDEAGLYENLLSSATAPYAGPRRVLLLVPDAADPAHGVAQAAAHAASLVPGAPTVEVLLTGGAGGSVNGKIAQLAVGLAAAGPAEVVVQGDSDVRLQGDDLSTLVAALCADERAGVAFASPVEYLPQTAADRASAALVGASQQNFLALYAVSRLVGAVPKLPGALCAHRREALERIGGFAALGDYLGEDHEIAQRMVRAGYRVVVSRRPARCTDGGRRPGEVVARVGRWLMVVRAQSPALLIGYPLALAATPLHLALTPLLRSPRHLAMTAGLLMLRSVLGFCLGRIHERPRGGLLREVLRAGLDVLRGETLLLLGLVRSLASRRIRWRGRLYRIGAGGLLQALPPRRP